MLDDKYCIVNFDYTSLYPEININLKIIRDKLRILKIKKYLKLSN